MRRGYAFGVNPAVYSAPMLGRRATTNIFSLIVMATLIFVIVAVASDPVLAASAARILGTAWSDAVALISLLLRRAG